MATVAFDNATRQYPGNPRPSVDRLSVAIADGEFLVLAGPSGCGKSTALRMLAGLEEVNSGRILIGGRDVTTLSPKDRDVALALQNYALYPHMSVAENMGFALRIAGVDPGEITRRVTEAAKVLDLTPYLDRKPDALSGGQRQRVALGRAIVRAPQVFLLDEPLANLDAKLRAQTRGQIAALQRRLGVTTVYVTQHQAEARTLGDRVAVLRDGVLQQVAPPHEVYDRPANVFVAGFFGSPGMNLLTVPVSNGEVRLGSRRLSVRRQQGSSAGGRVVVGVRPEDTEVTTDDDGLALRVEEVEERGADTYVSGTPADPLVQLGGAEEEPARPFLARWVEPRRPARGSTVHVRPTPDRVHLFDAGTGVRLEP